jgi:hypothetical protein
VAGAVPVRPAADQIEGLIHSLARRGYQVFGPAIRDRAVVYGRD